MTDELEYLKQRIPLLDYLQQRNWTARRVGAHLEFVGLCPLHPDTRPSFYVNASENLFYCHGCGRGGDLIRFIGLSQGLSFRQSVAYLQRQIPPAADSEWLETVASFYPFQLHRYAEAVPYLQRRGLRDAGLIEELGIGYAPAIGKLRNHLVAHGYGLDRLLETGLITPQGRDTFCRRVIKPWRPPGPLVNLYGRSIGAAFPHRLLPRPKGGLFAWDSVCHSSHVILVEGVFDLALLWQEGFRNTTCAIGTHLTPLQWDQLCDSPDRRVDIVFDQDDNQAGQQAAQALAERLHLAGLTARIVRLPAGQDPNSFFLGGANRGDF